MLAFQIVHQVVDWESGEVVAEPGDVVTAILKEQLEKLPDGNFSYVLDAIPVQMESADYHDEEPLPECSLASIPMVVKIDGYGYGVLVAGVLKSVFPNRRIAWQYVRHLQSLVA